LPAWLQTLLLGMLRQLGMRVHYQVGFWLIYQMGWVCLSGGALSDLWDGALSDLSDGLSVFIRWCFEWFMRWVEVFIRWKFEWFIRRAKSVLSGDQEFRFRGEVRELHCRSNHVSALAFERIVRRSHCLYIIIFFQPGLIYGLFCPIGWQVEHQIIYPLFWLRWTNLLLRHWEVYWKYWFPHAVLTLSFVHSWN
jgi:hypothetical protein